MASNQIIGDRSKIDARVISFCSREVQTFPLLGSHGAEMFTYYDFICVDKVDVDNKPPLSTAYDHAVKMNKQIPKASSEFHQAHLVFTDIRTSGSGSKYGYTEDEIESFWENTEKMPILFMTMIHLARNTKLQTALDRIEATMRDNRYLVYLGFDYGDLILFFRGNSFKEYANLVFQINYSEESLVLVSSVTLYSFVWEYCNTADESFIAHFRMGVTDYNCAKETIKAIQKVYPDTVATWSLGRQDVGLFCSNATLLWIKEIYSELARKQPSHEKAHWCTTRDLSILIPVPEKNDIAGSKESIIKVTTIRDMLGKKVRRFAEAYKERCNKLKVKEDMVWLNWLAESCFLAATFFDNKMSFNMGVCLVPQFVDMFDYMTSLFEEDRFDIGNMKQARNGMSSFFSNILTLIDSMNHSNCQSIQTPAFHMMAFDMPPQIMAYYTAITQLFIEAFRDDEHFYGFTISPQFTQELTVKSLALQDVIPGDQFISINIGERSLYNLQMTTEVMAHEISHFVGDRNRCRQNRKEYMVKCALHRLISLVLSDILKRISRDYGLSDAPLPLPDISILDKYKAIDELYKKLIRCESVYGQSNANVYTVQVEEYIDALPRYLLRNPELSNSFFDAIYRHILTSTPDERQESYVMKLAKIMNIGIPSTHQEKLLSGECAYYQSAYAGERDWMVCVRVHELYQAELKRLVKSGNPVLAEKGPMKPEYLELTLAAQLRYLFQETFADLQTTLLLELDWNAYYDYLRPAENADSDICTRVLAIIRTLAETGKWDADEIKKSLSAMQNSPIPSVKSLADLHPLLSADRYSEEKIDPIYVHYLTEYLSACKKQIDISFKTQEGKGDSPVSTIRRIHTALSDGTSVLHMQNAVTDLIRDYKDRIELHLEIV